MSMVYDVFIGHEMKIKWMHTYSVWSSSSSLKLGINCKSKRQSIKFDFYVSRIFDIHTQKFLLFAWHNLFQRCNNVSNTFFLKRLFYLTILPSISVVAIYKENFAHTNSMELITFVTIHTYVRATFDSNKEAVRTKSLLRLVLRLGLPVGSPDPLGGVVVRLQRRQAGPRLLVVVVADRLAANMDLVVRELRWSERPVYHLHTYPGV
jgi:hypothetical protein